MKYPPDQFLAALRVTRCPEALLGAAQRYNIYGMDDLRHELLVRAWQRGVEAAGRDIEVLLPQQQTAILTNLPPTLEDDGLNPVRITVSDELVYEMAGVTVDQLTPEQRRAVREYCRAVERAFRHFAGKEAPAMEAWHRASIYLEGR